METELGKVSQEQLPEDDIQALSHRAQPRDLRGWASNAAHLTMNPSTVICLAGPTPGGRGR